MGLTLMILQIAKALVTSGQMPVRLLNERGHIPHMVSIRTSADATSEHVTILQHLYVEVSLTTKYIKTTPHE